ncbi:MAG: murein biosynthesis integral membrane protein MurJ [Victivallaceae bacterium]
MSPSYRNILRSSMGVLSANLLSRILGFFRIIIEANVLGGGVYKAGWVLAFTIANIFRRILGEGALAQALIPMLSSTLEKEGVEASRRQLNAIFFWLSALLALISIFTALIAMVLKSFVTSEHAVLACTLIPLLSPYILIMCLVGILSSVLNTFRIFFLPALGALFLNIFMIGGMLIIPYFGGSGVSLLENLAYAVLISGLIEFSLMLWLMKWKKILPKFRWENIRNRSAVTELGKLALPGIIGTSAYQVSVLVDRFLSSSLGAQAVSALEYSERLVYFPVGVVAVSISGVMLAEMSRSVGRGDFEGMLAQLRLGLRHISFMAVPVAAFMIVFRTEILEGLLLHGKFTRSDLDETAFAMLFYSLGIPFFCSFKIITNAFYSRKDMVTPVIIGICAIILNITLNLILMRYLRQGGIALATVAASLFNNFALLLILRRKLKRTLGMWPVNLALWRNLLTAFAAGYTVHWMFPFLADGLAAGGIFNSRMVNLAALLLGLGFCGALYLFFSWLLRCSEIPELLSIFSRKLKR